MNIRKKRGKGVRNDRRSGNLGAGLKLLHQVRVLLTLAVLLSAPPAPASTPQLPAYLPVPPKLAKVAQALGSDFDKYEFIVAPNPNRETKTVEGKSMHFVLGDRWGHSDSGDPSKVAESWASMLEGARWKLICRCGTNPIVLTAELEQESKDIWVEISLSVADSVNVTIIERAAAARSVALDPPAPTPEKFSDLEDFPYLKHLPGSKLVKTIRVNEPLEVEVDSAPPIEKKRLVAQSYVQKEYAGPADLSAHEPYSVYRDALKKTGWQVVHTFEGSDRSLDAHYTGNGREVWADLHFWSGGRIEFRIADLGANQLARELETQGHVAIYGIYFDTDSARLRSDSEPALRQVLALLRENTKLSVEIQGHTDSRSTRAHNQVLSENRAASVKQYLVGKGIEEARLTTAGFADTRPVADNKTESGRARNRRVELVRK